MPTRTENRILRCCLMAKQDTWTLLFMAAIFTIRAFVGDAAIICLPSLGAPTPECERSSGQQEWA
jgi:hypothetical protein